MSTSQEKYRAICRAGFFLEKILYNKKVPENLRHEARALLRHFPMVIETEQIFLGFEKEYFPLGEWKYLSEEKKLMRKELDKRQKEDHNVIRRKTNKKRS